LVLAAVCLPAGSVLGEDWPRWRGPRGDGTWLAPKLPERWPAGGLTPQWRLPVRGGYAGPAVAQGRLVLLEYERDPNAGAKDARKPDGWEIVVCLDAADGRKLWEHRYPVRYGGLGGYANGPRAMATIDGPRVYTLGAVGHFHCFEVHSGRILWAKDMVREYRARVPEWGFAASPVIVGDCVVVHTGAEPDGCYLAFDRVSGAEVWRGGSDPAGYCTPILVQAPSGPQLIGWTPEHILGLDPKTGKVWWSIRYRVTYGVSIATPIFQENIVFVSGYWEGAKAIRLGPNPTDAELLWEDPKLQGLMAQPLYRDGLVYLLEKDSGLVCFELATGRKLWEDHRLTPRGRNPHVSMIWVNDGDRALILNAVGELILARLTPEGYLEQSRTRVVPENVWAHPAFAGRFLYVRTDGGERAVTARNLELLCLPLAPP
jgi:outer membrane protein assembly factor BamB